MNNLGNGQMPGLSRLKIRRSTPRTFLPDIVFGAVFVCAGLYLVVPRAFGALCLGFLVSIVFVLVFAVVENIRTFFGAIRSLRGGDRTESTEECELEATEMDYLFEFARKLAADLPSDLVPQRSDWETELPYMLQAFAAKLEYVGGSDLATDRLLYFIYLFSSELTDAVIGILASQDNVDKPPEPAQNSRFVSIQDLRYGNGCPAYTWLLNSVLRLAQMDIPGPVDQRLMVRRQILQGMGEPIPKHALSTRRQLKFVVPWVAKFLNSQEYGIPAHEALPLVLVLTGTGEKAYATSCLEYVRMVWPDSGPQLLELYALLLRNRIGTVSQCTLFDQTHLAGLIIQNGDCAEIMATGEVYAIAELGEQLAWLSASLTSAYAHDRLLCQYPASCEILTDYRTSQGPFDLARVNSCVFTLEGTEVPKNPTDSDIPGKCWMGLFGNPILVNGYPIPIRTKHQTGIEIPLNVMADLANARKVEEYEGSILLKGLSTVVMVTGRDHEAVYWHQISNPDGSSIALSDERIKDTLAKHPVSLKLSDLKNSRHCLGWCADVENITGSVSANYSIGWSGLSRPSAGFAFEKISISGGMYITGGLSTIIGKKDKPVHARVRDDYTTRLKWISKKYIVFYDVEDRRAWLVDGTSALLHLVRAALKHDSEDDFNPYFLYDPTNLQEAPQEYDGKSAAIHVLMNEANLSLALWRKPEEEAGESPFGAVGLSAITLCRTKANFCLKDKVEDMCDILERILAYQADVSAQDGLAFRIRLSARRQLVGFDFMDLATNQDPIWPRTTSLRATGKGWVDFTKAINAVTLVGTGFGELIRPLKGDAPPCTSCCANAAVPTGQDVLAVGVPELSQILRQHGSRCTSPWRLVDDIYWHSPDLTFEPCECAISPEAKRDRIQVLMPLSFPGFLKRSPRSPTDISQTPRGAFMFAHSRQFPLRWRDKGGPGLAAPEEPEMPSHDSGISMSMGSSSHSTPRLVVHGTDGKPCPGFNESGGIPSRERLLTGKYPERAVVETEQRRAASSLGQRIIAWSQVPDIRSPGV
ncbi:hypothetical protein F4780DRAFT_197425 [Xylariomycetidae sp. FL0641]|nr:hypothetical protein F4780DRAFT_197425 [Xylariomycetidae sp. FL0641]